MITAPVADIGGPLGLVLSRADRPRRAGRGWLCRCPAHDDRSPSLSITAGDDGRVLLNCHSGCAAEDVARAWGLTMKDLFPERASYLAPVARGCTLADLAHAKGLPLATLETLGWRDGDYHGHPCVEIPYYDAAGNTHRVRIRRELSGEKRFAWGPGEGTIAYAPDRREFARAVGELVIVEGETDVAALMSVEIPAMGCPGATSVHVIEPHHVDGLARVYVSQESDKAGDMFVAAVRDRLKALGFAGDLYALPWPGAKDACELLKRDREGFKAKVEAAMRSANGSDSCPTYAEPLRGLKHLGPLALVGREAILAKASEPVDYAWKDIVVNGTICVLAGPSGEGKTTLLFMLMVARASVDGPVEILGRYVAPIAEGKRVVLIEGEHGEKSASKKLMKTIALLGLSDALLERFVIVARKAVIIGSPAWDDVERMVAEGIVSDIAIDTLARCTAGDANAERDQAEIFNRVAKTIDAAPSEDTKPTAWIIAHTRKKSDGPVHMQDISGSAQRAGQADTVCMVNASKDDAGRVVKSRVTFEKLREDPDDWPEPCEFTIRGEAGAPALVQGQHVAGEVDGDKRPLRDRVLEALSAGPQTKNSLATTTKRNFDDVDVVLDGLLGERAIVTTYIKVRGKDAKAFQLTEVGRLLGRPEDL